MHEVDALSKKEEVNQLGTRENVLNFVKYMME